MSCQAVSAPEAVDSAWELEHDAAQLSRGLAVATEWKEVASGARALVSEAVDWPASQRAAWSDEAADHPFSAALQSAARALDGAAVHGATGGRMAREAGLWAAGAWALGGNFPSASVALKRTFPRLDGRAPLTTLASQSAWPDGSAALVAAFAPTLAPLVAAHSAFAARVTAGALDEDDDAVFDLLKAEVAQEWFDLARAAFSGARALSTRRALEERGGALAGHAWAALLARRVLTLLPP